MATDAMPSTLGGALGALGAVSQRRSESAGSGAAAVRWLRPRLDADAGLQPESEPAHPLELQWARQVEQRFQQLAVLFGERRVRSVPEVEWMDISVAVAVEASASMAEARRRFYAGMVAVQEPPVEQIFRTAPLNLERGFADTAALGQQMRVASQRYYESVVGRNQQQSLDSGQAALDEAAPKRRVSQTSSEDGSEGENPAGPVSVSNDDGRAQTTDGIVATRKQKGWLCRDEDSRAQTSDGIPRSDAQASASDEPENVVELREALRQARVHLSQSLPAEDDRLDASVDERDENVAVGFATPERVSHDEQGSHHPRTVSPSWDSCGPGVVLQSFPVEDAASLGFESPAGTQTDSTSAAVQNSPSVGRRTRPSRSQYSRVVAVAAEDAELRLVAAEQEAERLEQAGDSAAARAAATNVKLARQQAEEAQKLCDEVEKAEAQLMLRAAVSEAVSLQDQLQSPQTCANDLKLQDTPRLPNDVDAPLVLADGRTLSVQVRKDTQGAQSTKIVLTQSSTEASVTNMCSLDDGTSGRRLEVGSAHATCRLPDSDARRKEAASSELAERVEDRLLHADPVAGTASASTAKVAQLRTAVIDDESDNPHPFGSKEHIDALLAALHTEESTDSGSPGSPGVSSAVAQKQRAEAKIKRQQLVRNMLELAVAEQTKKERRKARLTMPGGRFLPSETTVVETPLQPPVEANPLKLQADLWARAQELTGERQKGQRVARALIESFEPDAATNSKALARTAATEVGVHDAANDSTKSAATNIAATEAWHSHGDGIEYAAIDIPETVCTSNPVKLPGDHLSSASSSAERAQVPASEACDHSMASSDSGIVRVSTSSPSPQAVVETVARDKVLQKRAQVEVQEMLARIREKTKRHASGVRSARKYGSILEDDSASVQDTATSKRTAWSPSHQTATSAATAGAAFDCESSHRLAARQKARGQVQEVLTKIKRQAKLHASPTKRSHPCHTQNVAETGMRAVFESSNNRGQNKEDPTGWVSATNSAAEDSNPVRKMRQHQRDLDADDKQIAPTEIAFVQPMVQLPSVEQMKMQRHASLVPLPSEPTVDSQSATRSTDHNAIDVDTSMQIPGPAHQTETVDAALRHSSAFTAVCVGDDSLKAQERAKESFESANGVVGCGGGGSGGRSSSSSSSSSSSKTNFRQRDLRALVDDKGPGKTESADVSTLSAARPSLTSTVAQSSPPNSTALPAADVESVIQSMARTLTPQVSASQQDIEIVFRVDKHGNDDLSSNVVNIKRRVAECLNVDSSQVDLRIADQGKAAIISAPCINQDKNGKAIFETVRAELATTGVVAELVEEMPVFDIKLDVRQDIISSLHKGAGPEPELTAEEQQTVLETIAKAVNTDASRVQIVRAPHASSSDDQQHDSSLTVRISAPVITEPDSGADRGTTARKVVTCIEQAVADGSMTTMLKHCGVQSLSQVHVSGEPRLNVDASPQESTQQSDKNGAANDRRRLTEDGIVVGVPVVGGVARSVGRKERAVDKETAPRGIPLTPPRYTKHAVPKQMPSVRQSAASYEGTFALDEGEAPPSPGSPEREEFLKRRARMEMQTMLAHIEEKQSLNLRSHKNAGSGARQISNQSLAPLDAVATLNCDSDTEHDVGRLDQRDTAMLSGERASNGVGDSSPSRASASTEFSATPQLQAKSNSNAQLSREPRTPKSTAMDIAGPNEKAPRTSTKEAVSAILAQLKSLDDDKFDISTWTGDMRDLGGSGADNAVESSPASVGEIPRMSARSLTPADSSDDLQPDSEDLFDDSNREAIGTGDARQSHQHTLLRILSDGQICWRILRSIPWQQLRVFQRVSTDFRTACKVVLALRPQAICVGGGNRGRALRSAVAYDVAADEWSLLAPMAVGRINSAVCGLVPGAGVLVAGGYNGKGIELSAERFDIRSGEWVCTAPMPIAKSGCRGVLLQEAGIALVLGGYDQNHQTLARVDAYDWQRDEWNATQFPAMYTSRYDCAACSLPRNRVVVAGGTDADQSWVQSAEVYDHAVGNWSPLPSLGVQRDRCAAVGLSLGSTGVTVLVLGGSSHPPSDAEAVSGNAAEKRSSSPPAPGVVDLSTCEALSMPKQEDQTDTGRSDWVAAPQLKNPRSSFGAVAIGGVVLAVGGEASGTVEQLNVTGRGSGWTEVAKLPHPRIGAGAAACPMGAPPS